MSNAPLSRRLFFTIIIMIPISSAVLSGSVAFFLDRSGAPLATLLIAVLISAFLPVFVSIIVVYIKVRRFLTTKSRRGQ